MLLALSLLILVLAISIYDWRTQLIPAWVTLPLLAVGMMVNFPGAMETWLACGILLISWRFGWIGGGDAKLWMALLWAVPISLAPQAVLAAFASKVITSLLQIAWRKWKKQPVFGVRSPAAWRAIPFALWLVLVLS
jgi:Flp pilus assembly protein protease CpaA